MVVLKHEKREIIMHEEGEKGFLMYAKKYAREEGVRHVRGTRHGGNEARVTGGENAEKLLIF